MKTHILKTWPYYFQAVAYGVKKFELRRNDKDFQVDDIVILYEYDQLRDSHTGAAIRAKITFIFDDPSLGVQEGFVILSLDNIEVGGLLYSYENNICDFVKVENIYGENNFLPYKI